MDLDQLLDPNRLASIWNAATRRAPSRAEDPDSRAEDPDSRAEDPDSRASLALALRHDLGLGDEPGWRDAPDASTIAVVPRPDAYASFLALREQVAALFAEGTDARRILDHRLAAMDGALQGQGPVSVQDLDELEDLLEAFLVARNWAPAPGGGA